MTDPRAYWVGLNLVKGIGSVRFKTLLEAFGDPQSAWNASPEAWLQTGLSQKVVDSFKRVRQGVSLDQVWERIQALEVTVLTWDDEAYPRRLKEIDQPPPVLYVRGSLTPEDEWAVAIVGTRRGPPYGRPVAEKTAPALWTGGVASPPAPWPPWAVPRLVPTMATAHSSSGVRLPRTYRTGGGWSISLRRRG